MNNKKVEYFLSSLSRYFTDKNCPYCNSDDVTRIDQKYLVTRLFECKRCHLYFRHPKDIRVESESFYQNDYYYTSTVPSNELLDQYKKDNFKGLGKDYSEKAEIIRSLMAGRSSRRVVDYGSSWGYVSYQFLQKGFDVQSFEISVPMGNRGNELLGLNIKSQVNDLIPGNDIFFSAHVIEHLPDLKEFIQTAKKLLFPDGLMLTFCPNGSQAYREKDKQAFHSVWGMVHPSYLNKDFFAYVFKDNPYLITSAPYNLSLIANWDKRSQVIDRTDGDEIFVISAVNQNI